MENANSKTRNDITAFAAVIFFPEELFLAIIREDYYRDMVIVSLFSGVRALTVTLLFASFTTA